MILLIVLLAGILSAYYCSRHSALRAYLAVYLPLLAFWPIGYGFIFHGAEISPEGAASFPILFSMFRHPAMRWKWQWTDLLLVLYLLEGFYAQYHIDHDFSVGGAETVGIALTVVPAYFFGRYLVESKDARLAVVKRFVFLLFIVGLLSLYEYRMTVNPFEILASRVSGLTSSFFDQMRWGFARVAGPYGHAILAGIMFVSALLFQLWLAGRNTWEPKFRGRAWLPGKKTTYITVGLLGAVWMTQSRGPWMGGALGFILFMAGRARKLKKGIARAVIVSLLLFTVFYVITDKYTDVGNGPMTQDQQNAVYRRDLLINYLPVVKQGGLYGFGSAFPRIDGQGSIDNFYLLTALQTGYVGISLFVGLIALSAFRLLRVAWVSRDRDTATFALCLLGIVVGVAATLTTVYLGAQTVAFFFLILGWAQAMEPRRESPAAAVADNEQISAQRFAYRRVFS